MKVRQTLVFAVFSLAVAGWSAGPTEASIVATSRPLFPLPPLTSGVEVVSPPPSVKLNDFQANSFIRVFMERRNVLLGSSVSVNATAPGTYNQLNQPVAPFPTLALGTAVDSYFIHFDPTSGVQTRSGTVTFDRDILGVIFYPAGLDASDSTLGAVGITAYPTLLADRGMDLAVNLTDFLTISADRRMVSFRTGADTAVDQVRVITAANLPQRGVTLTIFGADNAPTISVSNDGLVDMTSFKLTIGDLSRNFDCVITNSDVFIVGAGGSTLNTPEHQAFCNGGVRANLVDYSFSGFGPGEVFRFTVDVDRDSVDSDEDYWRVLFDRGGSSSTDNSSITITFSDGFTVPVPPSLLHLPDFAGTSTTTYYQMFIPTNRAPVAQCGSPTVPADEQCQAQISVDNGSYDPDGDPLTRTQAPPGPYGLGATAVTLTVEDHCSASSMCSAMVTVRDETPPSVTWPGDLAAECTSAAGAAVPFNVGADDNCSTDPAVACTPPGPAFPIGTTGVGCTATDESGNTTGVTFGVTVSDTTRPTVAVPGPIFKECTSQAGTPVTFAVSASDTCSTPTPQCSPSSGDLFALTTTKVKCTATDLSGNVGSAGFDVTVRDTTPPSLQVPGPILRECTSPAGAAVPFTVTASDACSTPSPQCSSGSGDVFGLGTTNVNCTATDPSENVGVAGFGVTVQDTVPPLITAPTSVSAECTSSAGAQVTFNVSADDVCSMPAILCGPKSSGDLFPIGPTAVTCTATDAAGHTSMAPSFVVDVTSMAPTLTAGLSGNPLVAIVDTSVGFSVSFSDASSNDVHDATWDFGDGSGMVAVASATSPLETNHTYTAAGVYKVTVAITDRCGNSISDSIFLVVFDPADGFTTGGGWFVPELGSFIDDGAPTDGVSKANFGFIVKYKKGKSTPDGNLEFQYKVGNINLKSTTMDWMVISATKVRFKGVATINGSGSYTFKVTAEDNGEPGTNDTFKIEIWMGPVDTENSPPNPKHMTHGTLGGGNIQIHQ